MAPLDSGNEIAADASDFRCVNRGPDFMKPSTDKAPESPQYAIIIPACDEEPCLGPVLDELLAALDPARFQVVVGVNGSSDGTACVARERGVLVAETERRGYGFGCQRAIDLVFEMLPSVRAFIFYAADGASAPEDIARLVAAVENGYPLVLGTRTLRLSNWRSMTLRHVIANMALGAWCGLLTGRFFSDLGPLRLIDRRLFAAITPQEFTFGWTIEAQITATLLGVPIREIPVQERRRRAGQQKISGVTWSRTALIGCKIMAAGWRVRRRVRQAAAEPAIVPVPQPQRQT